jgi:hypothetical protein
MSQTFLNQRMRPFGGRWRLDGMNAGDGPAAFSDEQSPTGANTFQVATQVRLQLADADSVHHVPFSM